jgi:glycosyltransferase involved in cell wall biosynthesis
VPKIFHTFHGHIFHSYFGSLKTRLIIIIEKILACFTNKIIVISNEQLYEICNKYRIAHKRKFKTIPLGFDFSKFETTTKNRTSFQEMYKISKNDIVVGIVGRLVAVKNHKMFLDVAKIVLAENSKVTFIIIGDGEEKANLIKYAKDNNIYNKVIFTGWIKDSSQIYNDIDIVALTSLNEGTPVTLIEALYNNKQVINTYLISKVYVIQTISFSYVIIHHSCIFQHIIIFCNIIIWFRRIRLQFHYSFI